MVISGFEDLKRRLGDISPVSAVVAAANDRHTLQAVFAASRDGVIRPILVGERTGLNDLARELGHPLSPEQIVDGDGPEDCASKAVALIRQGRGIEVNTNRGHQPLPGEKWLRMYRDLGGEIVTLGSDAHATRQVGCAIREGQALLRRCGFSRFCTFQRMEPVWHTL